MAVTPEAVRRMAELSGLRLAPSEIDAMAAELGSIMEHMDVLRDVDTGQVGVGAEGAAPLRPDRKDPDSLAEGPEAQAPDWRDGFFTVPRLASHDVEAEEDVSDEAP